VCDDDDDGDYECCQYSVSFAERKLETTWMQAQNAFVKVVGRMLIVIVLYSLCMSDSTLVWCGVVATTMLPTCVCPAERERNDLDSIIDTIVGVLSPGDDNGCP